MLPIQKILCPIDFSEPSYQALDIAAELAAHFGARLVILHVVAEIPYLSGSTTITGLDIPKYQKQLEEISFQKISEIIENRIPKGVEAHPVITVGKAADEIVAVADEQKPDILVIATHGETGVRHLVFGSVAEKVVRHIHVPVLTVRASG
jgi:nucleotide-binding universal stress UspA family protein